MPKRKQPYPQPIPMLATQAKAIATDPDWLYEIKWHGYRAMAEVKNGKTRLLQDGEDITDEYRLIRNEFDGQPDMIVDGVIVVLDQEGKPDYDLLKQRDDSSNLVYYVFDLLFYDGESWVNRALIERKEMLLHVLKKDSIITYSDHFDDGEGLLEQMQLLNLDVVIAKRKESIYEPAKKSKDWLSMEVVKKKVVKPKMKPKPKMPDVYFAVMDEIKRVRERRLKEKRRAVICDSRFKM